MVRVHNMGMKGQRRYWKREAFLSKHRENVQSKVKTSSGESCDISRVVKSQGLDKTITEDRNKSERNKDMEPETIESNSTNFPCKDCSMVFKSYYRRKTHTNFVHLGIKYSCDQCEYLGRLGKELTRHVKTVHSKEQIKCPLCKYVGKTNKCLALHTKIVHSNLKFPCDQCKYVAKHDKELKQHKKNRHRINSDKCDYFSSFKFELNEHKAVSHKGVRFQCSQCIYSATKMSNL